MTKYIPLDKWKRLFKIIRDSGGLFKSGYKLWRYDTLKEGRYVGCDCNGNKYYTNDNYMIGRNRWVEHNMNYRWDYEATQVTSEWYGWLHYKTDKLPCEDSYKYELQCSVHAQAWLQPFAENATGTDEAYYPYSTTRPKINVWDGTRRPSSLSEAPRFWWLPLLILAFRSCSGLGIVWWVCPKNKKAPKKRSSESYQSPS